MGKTPPGLSPIGPMALCVIVILIAVLGGKGSWIVERLYSSPVDKAHITQTANQKTLNDTPASKSLTHSSETIAEFFKSGAKPGETVFAAKTQKTDGIQIVIFGVQVTKSDGGDFEAFVLFGDGEEQHIAHWTPESFNEEITHEYQKPGQYKSSLVLVPKKLLSESILQRKEKIRDLPETIVIKNIDVEIDSSGHITIKQ